MKILSESMVQRKLDEALKERSHWDAEVKRLKNLLDGVRLVGEDQTVLQNNSFPRPPITVDDVDYLSFKRDQKAEARYKLFKKFLGIKEVVHFSEFTDEVKKYGDDVKPDSFNGFLSVKAQEGELIRVGKGKYSLPKSN